MLESAVPPPLDIYEPSSGALKCSGLAELRFFGVEKVKIGLSKRRFPTHGLRSGPGWRNKENKTGYYLGCVL
jgi:hypothetical protein